MTGETMEKIRKMRRGITIAMRNGNKADQLNFVLEILDKAEAAGFAGLTDCEMQNWLYTQTVLLENFHNVIF